MFSQIFGNFHSMKYSTSHSHCFPGIQKSSMNEAATIEGVVVVAVDKANGGSSLFDVCVSQIFTAQFSSFYLFKTT